MNDHGPNPGAHPEGTRPPTDDDPNKTRYFPPQGAPAQQPDSAGSVPHYIAQGTPGGQALPQSPSDIDRRNRERTLLGTIMVAGGLLFLVAQLNIFDISGSLILLAIGGILMYAYFTTRQGYRIGFLIPGAILLGIGVGQALDSLPWPHFWQASTFTLGLGFCLIWLLERKHWWALIPGGILMLVSLSTLSVLFQFWPVALIALGIYLLYDQSRRRSFR